MGFPAHGFDTLKLWNRLEPWEQDVYFQHFCNQKTGAYQAKTAGNAAETKARSNDAWAKFIASKAT